MVDWVKKQEVPGLTVDVVTLPNRTPLIFVEIESTIKDKENAPTILLYAHYDKQPPLRPWSEGLDPYVPVIREGPFAGKWLYGRGGADDGYGLPASLIAIQALREQNIEYGRVIILAEGCEESGSGDLPIYMDHLKERIGNPDLVVCLDSGAGNYETMWMTTSLRGVMSFKLRVSLMSEGVHSGTGSGIVASSFRVARQLLSRLEDEKTGVVVDDLQVEIPDDRVVQAQKCGVELGDDFLNKLPKLQGVSNVSEDATELLLNGTWRPTVCVVGVDGIPPTANGGNVLRSYTTLKVSIRLPPTLDPKKAEEAVRRILLSNPPYGAHVSIDDIHAAGGWASLPFKQWTTQAFDKAAQTYFGRPAQYLGEGGTIPFLGLLQRKFPEAQFCVTGILGPKSNAHSIDEGFPIEFAKKLTCCISTIVSEHYVNCK